METHRCLLTVEVRADVQHAGLAASNGLRETEQRRAEGGDALRGQNLGGVQGWSRGGDLDAVAVPANASSGKLLVIEVGVVEGSLEVVGLGWQGLEKDAAADQVDVLLAHEDSLGVAVSDIALVLRMGG